TGADGGRYHARPADGEERWRGRFGGELRCASARSAGGRATAGLRAYAAGVVRMATRERLICASTALVDGGDGVRFEVLRHGERQAAFAVRYFGTVYAYLNRCAHVPIELDWQRGRFFDM